MRRALFLAALTALAGCLETPDTEIFANGSREFPVLPTVEPFPVPIPTLSPPNVTPVPPFPTPSPPEEPPTPTNLSSILLNGGFEQGEGTSATGWEVDESPPGTSPTGRFCSTSRTGDCALALGRPARGVLARQDVAIEGDRRTIAATFWVRDAADVDRSAGWFRATLGAIDANGVVLAADTLVFEGDPARKDWTFEQLGPFRVPNGTVLARLWFEVHGNTRGDASESALVTYLDDVALYHTFSPDVVFANGGVEDEFNPWGRTEGVTRECSVARSGQCSLRLEHSLGAKVDMSFGVFGERIAVTAHMLSEGARTFDAPMRQLNLTFYAEDGTVLARYGGGSTSAVEGWTLQQQGPIEVPATTYKVHLEIGAARADGVVTYVDDVEVAWS